MTRRRVSRAEADKAVAFFPKYLTYSKARFAGKPFELRRWQARIIRDLFGPQVWDEEVGDWVRQVRTAYIEIPRKNGKTELGAGIALKLLFADGENGAEIYSVAEDLDQANKVFAAARTMVESNPALNKRAKCYKRLIEHQNGSIYRIIPGDAGGNHGHNPHGVIFDELHTQKTRDLWDVMTSGQGVRSQPLTVAFSTAGTDRESICWEQHDYGEKWAQGIIADPTFYYVRYGLDEGQDWENRKLWRKWNPALGDFLLTSFLESEHAKAKESPARQNTWRNLYANEWTSQSVRWIDMKVWDAQAWPVVDGQARAWLPSGLEGRDCYGGLDIGSVSDLTAWVLVFPEEDGSVRLLPHFFCPEAQLEDGQNKTMYRTWADKGYLTVTPGNATDQEFVRDHILRDAIRFNLHGTNIDFGFQGGWLASALIEEGLDVTLIRQNALALKLGMTEFETLLLDKRLHHGGNPVLRWMADNVVVKRDSDDNLKIDKAKAQGKVDGIAATVFACDLLARDNDNPAPMILSFEA